MKFAFQVTPETWAYSWIVAQCLVRYCGMVENEAVDLINKYWGNRPFLDNDLRQHEEPYFYAMNMAHGKHGDNNPNWESDASLWPPPRDYFDWLKTIDWEQLIKLAETE